MLFYYVIVFFIQRTQISANKDIISSMKTFIEVFDVDQVKKYVDLKNEATIMDVMKLFKDDKRIQDLVNDVANNRTQEAINIANGEINEANIEITSFTVYILKSLPKEESIILINKLLPKTKHLFLKLIEGNGNSNP